MSGGAMYCEHCGARQPLGAVVCEVCGGASGSGAAGPFSGGVIQSPVQAVPLAAWEAPRPGSPFLPVPRPAKEGASRELLLPIGAAAAVGVGLFHFSELVYYADALGDRTFLGFLPGTLAVLVLAGGWSVIAGVLAVSLFRRARMVSLPRWLLPVVLIAELSVQAWWADTLQELSLKVLLSLLAAACFLRLREEDTVPAPSAISTPVSVGAPPLTPPRPVAPAPSFVPSGPGPSPLPGPATAPTPSSSTPTSEGTPADGATAATGSPGIRLLDPGPTPASVAAIIAVELGLPVEAVLQRIGQGPVVVFRGATRDRLADLRTTLTSAGAVLGAQDADA